MKQLVRPLTKKMIDKLEYCRHMEIENKTCLPEDIKYALAPLYKRGYIGLKRSLIQDKDIMVVFVTPAGINVLQYLEENKKSSVLQE